MREISSINDFDQFECEFSRFCIEPRLALLEGLLRLAEARLEEAERRILVLEAGRSP